MDKRLVPLVALALVAFGPRLSAQDGKKAPPSPADVEKAVKKRAEGWLADRAPDRLACKTCNGSGQEQQTKRGPMVTCESCKGSCVSQVRLEEAFWRSLDPEWRKGRSKDTWLATLLLPGAGDRKLLRWRGAAGAVEAGATVSRVVVCRDVVWTWTSVGFKPEGWVKRGAVYYLRPRVEIDPMETIEAVVSHAWFSPGTFSVAALHREAMHLRAPELEAGLTDLERDRRSAARAQQERTQLAGRVVSDMGVISDVTTDGSDDEAPTYQVSVECGLWTVHLRVPVPADPAGKEALEQALGHRDRKIAFTGKAVSLGRGRSTAAARPKPPKPRAPLPPGAIPAPGHEHDRDDDSAPLAGREGDEPETLVDVVMDEGQIEVLETKPAAGR